MGSEFVLQTTNQSLAHRLWRYATTPDVAFYPPGFCEEAEEVGPYSATRRRGPCLVHFKRSRLTAAEVNAWISGGPADSIVMRVYWLGSTPSAATSPEALLRQLGAAGPPPDGGGLRLQVYPRKLEGWLVDEVEQLGFGLQPVDPQWVLHVLCLTDQAAAQHGGAEETELQQQQQHHHHHHHQHQQQAGSGRAQPPPRSRFLYSLQPAQDLYSYTPDRPKRIPGELSKAAGKLAEALVAAGLRLTDGVAVDLGAAPGGWTHVLAQHARHVIAVDPAPLDARALLPNVTHFACKAEDAVEGIHELAGDAGIDLLVSDVNRHPEQAVDLLRPLLPLLHPGAAVILTCKFHGFGANRGEECLQQLIKDLGPGFERHAMLWLLANTQHEQTCVAWKAAEPPAPSGAAAAGGGAGGATA